MTLSGLCSKLGLNYNTVVSYKNKHNLTDIEVIMYYRPDCYINIQGELVIPNN